jgi:hypothetical protein
MTKLTLGLFITFCILLFAFKKVHTNGGNKNKVDGITTPTPLTDFGTATYRGCGGGLYPNGSNQRPSKT